MNDETGHLFYLPRGHDRNRSGRLTRGPTCRFNVGAIQGEIWGAVTAIAAVAAVGVSAASAYSNSKNQQAAAEAAAHQPGVVPAKFESPSDAYGDYYKDVSDNYGSLSDIATKMTNADNLNYRTSVGQVDSSLLNNVEKEGKITNNYLNGRVPKDVRDATTRNSAYEALTGGYGYDSGAGHALTARDLGTTTAALQQVGSGMLGSELSYDKSLTPYSVTADQLLLTPKELLSRQDSNDAYANAVLNKNKQIQYTNSLAQTAASSYNPTGAAVSSGIGALGGAASAIQKYQNSQNSSSTDLYGATQQDAAAGYYNTYTDPAMYNEAGDYIGSNSFGGG